MRRVATLTLYTYYMVIYSCGDIYTHTVVMTHIPKRRYMKPPYLAAKSRKAWCGSFLLKLIVGKFPTMGHDQGPGGFLGAWYWVTDHHSSVTNSRSSAGNGTPSISCFKSCQLPRNCLHSWPSSACALDMVDCVRIVVDYYSWLWRRFWASLEVRDIDPASELASGRNLAWLHFLWLGGFRCSSFRCYLLLSAAWRHLFSVWGVEYGPEECQLYRRLQILFSL